MNVTLFERICGNCKSYDCDTCFCATHPNWGEMVEMDTCKDWSEDDTIPK